MNRLSTHLIGCQRVAALTLTLVLVAVTPLAHAQAIQDPTRPADLAAGGSAGTVALNSGPQLQSIRLAPHGSSAIISGQRVVLGSFYGAAKVTSITENQVVLKSESGAQILTLFPVVDRRISSPSRPSHHHRSGSLR